SQRLYSFLILMTAIGVFHVFFLYYYHHRHLHSFPTRRSSDLKDFLKVRCRLALLPFLISCLIWLDLVASPTKSSNLSETAEVPRSEERFSRNAETELVCRLLLEKKKVPNPRVYQEYNSFQ